MAPVSVTRQARLLVGVAIVGAVPLTAGAILWLVGTVMGSVYHGHWDGTAGLGGTLLLAGLLCGLVLFLLAAAGERWTLPESWGQARKTPRVLTPLASPEQQAFLADAPPPEAFPAGPQAAPASLPFPAAPPFPADPPSQPFPAEPQPYLAEPQFPPDEQWPDPDPEPPPPPYPAFPNR